MYLGFFRDNNKKDDTDEDDIDEDGKNDTDEDVKENKENYTKTAITQSIFELRTCNLTWL